MKRTWFFVVVVFGMVGTAPLSMAASSGTATVTLAAAANAVIDILDNTVTLTPNATDYANDYVDAAGASGLRVRVKTNSSTGMVLKVRCADASPQIALADLLIRTQTAAGTGGSTLGSYTAITAADLNLWSTGVSQNQFLTVTTDIRIQNVNAYNDTPGGGTTNYSNTLTYTVVAQ